MLDLNSLFLLTRYKTSVQFGLVNDCASIANDCVVSSMIVFDKDRERGVTRTVFLNVSI